MYNKFALYKQILKLDKHSNEIQAILSLQSKFFDLNIKNNNLFLLNVLVIMKNDKHQF